MPLVNLERLARIEQTARVCPVSAKATRALCETVRALRQALGVALGAWEAHAEWEEGDEGAEHTEWWICQSVFDETGEPEV